jgi:hypothetical protein
MNKQQAYNQQYTPHYFRITNLTEAKKADPRMLILYFVKSSVIEVLPKPLLLSWFVLSRAKQKYKHLL